MKHVVYKIEYCNSGCVYFYHRYDDNENIWCARLDKKIFDNDGIITEDYNKREIPEICPLQEVTD